MSKVGAHVLDTLYGRANSTAKPYTAVRVPSRILMALIEEVRTYREHEDGTQAPGEPEALQELWASGEPLRPVDEDVHVHSGPGPDPVPRRDDENRESRMSNDIDAWLAVGRELVGKAAAFQAEVDALVKPPAHEWEVGDRARKLKGYAFDSEVRAVFTNVAGQTRLVCESTVIPGMLHIFSPEQMESVQ